MALPAQGLSGLSPKLHHQCHYKDVSIVTQAASVQACQRERERVLHEVCIEGKRPFVLLAVIRHRSASPPADYIYSQLPSQVKNSLAAVSYDASSQSSPLHAAFVRLCASFKKLSAYAESIFAYTETVAALLDLKKMQLHTVGFGQDAMAPYVVRSDGLEIGPTHRRSHYCDNHSVSDSTYDTFSGQNQVILGSAGLWKYTHPRKAALHSIAFSSASHLSTAAHHHDSASAIVRCALREVAARCEASPSTRVSCLNTLSQLDRLRPGSRSELLATSGIVPRMRGDVHPDLTAATLSFTAHSPPPVRLRRPQSGGSITSRIFRFGSFSELTSAAGSVDSSPRPGHGASPSAHSTRPHSPLCLTRRADDGTAMPDAAGKGKGQIHDGADAGMGSCWHSGGAGVAGEPALQMHSQPGSPLSCRIDVSGLVDEGAPQKSRRWALVRTYVNLLTRERRMRRAAWEEVSGAVLRRSGSRCSVAARDGTSDVAMTPSVSTCRSSSASSLQMLSNVECDESAQMHGSTNGAPTVVAGSC